MVNIHSFLLHMFAACSVILAVGCSTSSEPQQEQEVFTIDPQTGNTKIDAVIFRARLQVSSSPSYNDAPEARQSQEFTEALAELAEIAALLTDTPAIRTYMLGLVDDEQSHEHAMEIALNAWGIPEAQQDSTYGVFADTQIDSAWDVFVGADNAFIDGAEALRGMFLMRCFAVSELRKAYTSVTSDGARYGLGVLLKATTNHLMSTIIASEANSIVLPDSPDLSTDEVQGIRVRARARNFEYPW